MPERLPTLMRRLIVRRLVGMSKPPFRAAEETRVAWRAGRKSTSPAVPGTVAALHDGAQELGYGIAAWADTGYSSGDDRKAAKAP